MGIEFVLKVAGIGLLTAFINMVIIKSGRDEMALLIQIAGLIVVLSIIVPEIATLFETIRSVFAL